MHTCRPVAYLKTINYTTAGIECDNIASDPIHINNRLVHPQKLDLLTQRNPFIVYARRNLNGLAVLRTKQKQYDKAEILFDEALKGRRRELGNDHPDTLQTINDFGVLRREQKNCPEAEKLLRQALDGRKLKLGDGHPACFESMHELGVLYKEQERYEEAEKLLLEAIESRLFKLGDTHPHTLESIKNLITLYEAWNKPEKAEKWRANISQTTPQHSR